MIYSLQGLRAVAALGILAYHFWSIGGISDNLSELIVSFFLIVSGFLLSNKSIEKPGTFIADKIARLMPLNLLSLAYIVILFRGDFSAKWPAWLCDMLMLQSWIPDASFYYSGDPVAWFLCVIAFCYAVFPWLKTAFDRHFSSACISFVIVCLVEIIIGATLVSPGRVQDFFYVAPYCRVLDFVFGIILGRVYRKLNMPTSIRQTAAIIVLTFAILAAPHLPAYISATFWWFVPCGLLIYSVSDGDGRKGFLGKALSCRPLVWLGNISFGIFMYHFPVIWTVDIALNKTGLSCNSILQFVLVSAITIVAAAISHRYFERPVSRKIRQMIAA